MDTELQQIQLIDGEGNYNLSGIETFSRRVKLADCGLSYAVIAIMGPQSSGKSTLLNHLFGTKFVEMDALRGRSQTTKGVWLARAPNVEPTTLVMDLEGTDGRERGEDDTTFEKQSSLFALAVADVLLINMWCHDIGREHAANKPLLKIVFQMMMRLFTPRKTKLLFIIRDKTKTPLETLEPILHEDIHKIWDSLPKPTPSPAQQKEVQFEDFFQIEVVALSNFEEKEEQFKQQVAELRGRFQNSIAPGGIAGDRRGVVPGTALALSMQEMWKVIKDNKDLDLPAHKIMVATVRCEEIAAEKIAELKSNQNWLELERKTQLGPVPGFGKQAGDLLKAVLAGYDTEAAFFDESVRAEKRKGLFTSAVGVIHESFTTLLGHRRVEAVEKFKADLAASGVPSTSSEDASGKSADVPGFAEARRRCTENALKAFDKAAADALVTGAGWDYLRTRQKLQRDIDAHATAVRTERLAAIQTKAKDTLQRKLAEPASALLDAASPETWPGLRELLARETAHAKRELVAAVAGFELEPEENAALGAALEDAGRDAVERRAREESAQALIRMKERFNMLFGRDSESMPRTWVGKEDIRAITREARVGALRLLSVLAAVRLDAIDGPDTVSEALETLLEGQEGSMAVHAHTDGGSATGTKEAPSRNALAGATWENISSAATLLTPSTCRSLWRQFKAETEYTISSAIAAQEAHKRNNSWLPPPWAIVAMIVLGFNEFMALVRNPLLLCIVVAAYYVGRALWVQLDASAEFENGLVPGLLSISAKFVPTLLRMLKRLYEDGQHTVQHATGIQMHDFAASNNSTTTREHNGYADDASSSRAMGGDAASKPLRHRGSAAGTGDLRKVDPDAS